MTTPPVQPSAPESSSQGPWFTAPAAPPPPPPPTGANGFWDEVSRLGVVRDRGTGWLGGVCAGLAHRLGVDPLLVRALAIVLVFAGGFGLVAYLVAWLILPDTLGGIPLRDIGRGSVTGILLVVALAVILLGGLSVREGTWLGGWFVPLAVLALLVVVRASRRSDRPVGHAPVPNTNPAETTGQVVPPGPVAYAAEGPEAAYAAPPSSYAVAAPSSFPAAATPVAYGVPPVPPIPTHPLVPPTPQRRRAPGGTGAIVLGLATLGYGLGHLLDGPTRFNGSGHFLGLLIALGVSSIAALVLGLAGRRGGFASVLTVLLLLPVLVAGLIEVAPMGPSEGQVVTWTPTGSSGWNIGTGEATLDLASLVPTTDPAPTTGPTPGSGPTPGTGAAPTPVSLTASVGAGTLTVLVPDDVEVNLDSRVGLGTLDLGPFGPTTDAIGSSSQVTTLSTADADGPRAVIDLHANIGLGDLVLKEK